jgi:hypothetical protein
VPGGGEGDKGAADHGAVGGCDELQGDSLDAEPVGMEQGAGVRLTLGAGGRHLIPPIDEISGRVGRGVVPTEASLFGVAERNPLGLPPRQA